MKISNILSASLTLLAISPSLGCLHTYGQIDVADVDYITDIFVQWASTTDNGLDVSDTAWGNARIDQDGPFSIPYLAGYVYAFTQDGTTAWYSNGVNVFSFSQAIDGSELPQATWQTYNFGC